MTILLDIHNNNSIYLQSLIYVCILLFSTFFFTHYSSQNLLNAHVCTLMQICMLVFISIIRHSRCS